MHMAQIFGNFIEAKEGSGEYLKISFHPASAPLQQRWRNNGLSAAFGMSMNVTILSLASEASVIGETWLGYGNGTNCSVRRLRSWFKCSAPASVSSMLAICKRINADRGLRFAKPSLVTCVSPIDRVSSFVMPFRCISPASVISVPARRRCVSSVA